MAQDRWTRMQQLIALRLYMRMPFGRLHSKNPEIVELAEWIDRTPSAVAMKACNFASLDPTFRETNRTGLTKVSKADEELWNEFKTYPERVALEMEAAFAQLDPTTAAAEEAAITPPIGEPPAGETETMRLVRTRRVQSFFRAAVLTSYESRCSLSGLAIPELLVASHIIPWSQNVERRADPTNGLCLNALFDRAFDRGLISFDDNLKVLISSRLRDVTTTANLRCSLDEIAGEELRLPERFQPDAAAMAFHRSTVFMG